eukprot:TRINITY_DN14600_c0_g1_i1.p2 TRINITY_DN14600_c0_g1~~TRINITY_DN14600_c0_g1_i1.p2  ORF type:complete len:783 (-),score=127.30 TRINITY_DN14600_c0_g1_i1:649-2997(-)
MQGTSHLVPTGQPGIQLARRPLSLNRRDSQPQGWRNSGGYQRMPQYYAPYRYQVQQYATHQQTPINGVESPPLPYPVDYSGASTPAPPPPPYEFQPQPYGQYDYGYPTQGGFGGYYGQGQQPQVDGMQMNQQRNQYYDDGGDYEEGGGNVNEGYGEGNSVTSNSKKSEMVESVRNIRDPSNYVAALKQMVSALDPGDHVPAPILEGAAKDLLGLVQDLAQENERVPVAALSSTLQALEELMLVKNRKSGGLAPQRSNNKHETNVPVSRFDNGSTQRILEGCSNLQELSRLVESAANLFDHIQVCAAIGKAFKIPGLDDPETREGAQDLQIELLGRLRRKTFLSALGAREISNVLWALASSGALNRQSVQQQVNPLMQHAVNILDTFNPTDILGTCWAMAQAGLRPVWFLYRVAGYTTGLVRKEQVEDSQIFMARELSGILFTFAKQDIEVPELFKGIIDRIRDRVGQFDRRSLAHVFWACGMSHYYDKTFMTEACDHFVVADGELKVVDATQVLTGLTTFGIKHEKAINIILNVFNSPDLRIDEYSSLIWSCAVLGVPQKKIQKVLKHAVNFYEQKARSGRLSQGALRSIYFAYMLYEAYGERLEGIPDEMLQTCRDAWIKRVGQGLNDKARFRGKAVAEILTSMGYEAQDAYVTPDKQLCVHVSFKLDVDGGQDSPAQRRRGRRTIDVAVQVNGPGGYASNQTSIELALMSATRKVWEHKGWEVIVVSSSQWERCGGYDARREYLQNLIDDLEDRRRERLQSKNKDAEKEQEAKSDLVEVK